MGCHFLLHCECLPQIKVLTKDLLQNLINQVTVWPNQAFTARGSQNPVLWHWFLRGPPARRREEGLKYVFPIWDEFKNIMNWRAGLVCRSTGGAGSHWRALGFGHSATKRQHSTEASAHNLTRFQTIHFFRLRSSSGPLAPHNFGSR